MKERCIEGRVTPAREQEDVCTSLSAREILARVVAPAESKSPVPRLLVVLAHPDDEVLAMGARLERLRVSRLLTLTDGAPLDGGDARHHGFPSLEAYRAARREELHQALAHAGVPIDVAPPFDAQVPDQQASFHLVQLTRAIADVLKDVRPDAVLTHPYEGGHPDHDATAFAVHSAVRLVNGAAGRATASLPVVETPFYHVGGDGSMQTGSFLPQHQVIPVTECTLSPQERANKVARLACFRSQSETLAQFGVERELFRLAPSYDFTQRPHAGQLLYERFPWGMSGDQFCALACAALDELFGAEMAATTERTVSMGDDCA